MVENELWVSETVASVEDENRFVVRLSVEGTDVVLDGSELESPCDALCVLETALDSSSKVVVDIDNVEYSSPELPLELVDSTDVRFSDDGIGVSELSKDDSSVLDV